MKKTLIYIVGAGRSGTTLVDIMLGNLENSISLGEVNRFFKRNGYPPKRKKNSAVYEFWSNLRCKLINKGFTDLRELDQLFQNNEYHTAFFKSFFKKSDSYYVQLLNKQYEVLDEIVNHKTLIESSKYPSRALNISNYLEEKSYIVKYIYLKKDPVKVVRSFQKKDLEQPSKGFFMANLYYFIVNILCGITINILKKRGHKVCTIKYKDLINSPEKTLNRLGDDLNIDCSELVKKIANKEPLKTGYLFDGNRIRLKETLTLQTSDKKIKKSIKDYFTRIFNYIVYR
ncbi:sulfotransferase [Mangrovimonas spongiae]|uniref:Sulfotransferase n=1 Tax=Mangrovimonas spongiae TaxID=2494697 RepID=A0A428K585_9FLAO|nr:sulfotransferase [Mangrovimonas spongiae]RSK41522.1 hypothetical protein EJA19_01205 [Mangrovimonas spongiae]